MPAINPARLRQQAILLAEQVDEPAVFVRSLHHLFEFYAERVLRPGQAGEPPPLTTAYQVRPQVFRHILSELSPLAKDDPAAALELCDALWDQPYFEFRLLAAYLLGQIPSNDPQPITDRLQRWIQPDVEMRLVDALFQRGLEYLRQKHPQAVIHLADEWIKEKEIYYHQLGLRLIVPMIKDPGFENLPLFYRLIQPLARTAAPGVRPDMLDVLAALAQRSPNETAYFLRHTAELPNSPATPWFIRQLLPEFPEDVQEGLKAFSRELGEKARKKI